MDTFLRGYLVAALFTWDENSPSGQDYDQSGRADEMLALFSEEAIAKATADCDKFENENAPWLSNYRSEVTTRGDVSEAEYAGHDFWLTRNRHGTGFWDREGLNESTSKALTDAAHKFGECDLYNGDDGKLYFS